MLKFGIIGFGGLGKVHFNDYLEIKKTNRADIELVALCDIEPKAFTESAATNITSGGETLDLSAYTLYSDYKEMLAKEKLDFVITALPTYLHAQVAVYALNAGLHVFSEKPMAIDLESCQAMLDAAEKNDKKLMIGQCLRYEPGYTNLTEYYKNGELGKLCRAEFGRYSLTPTWSSNNWMMDEAKSGGAALDFHVHDVDYINFLLGLPKSVAAMATHEHSGYDSIVSTYYYDNCVVTAAADWAMPNEYPFTEKFIARFEKGTLEYLRGELTLYTDDGATKVELSGKNSYVEEVVDFADCIVNNRVSEINPPASCMDSIKLALAEKQAAKTGTIVNL